MNGLVALTGATGFVGRHLVPALAGEGLTLRVLTRRSAPFPPGVEIVEGDLADRAALGRLVGGAAAVIHLAGAIKARDARAFFAANEAGTAALAEAAAAAGVRRLVLISSLAAREPHLSDYAASKRAAEAALAAGFAGPRIVLRPGAIYGPGDVETLPFFRLAARGYGLRLAGTVARLGLVHVDDVVTAIRRALESGGEGGVFEIDDGAAGGYGWPDLLHAAERAAGRPLRQIPVPAAGLHVAAAGAQIAARLTGRPGILSPGKVREMLHGDWSRKGPWLGEIGGWTPALGLEEGFARTFSWYRAAGWIR